MSPLLLPSATQCLGHQKCRARLPAAAGMKPIAEEGTVQAIEHLVVLPGALMAPRERGMAGRSVPSP